jgi:two-component system, NarL family, nitrate/nitrite response regulator NarL
MADEAALSVVIADDHPIVLNGIRSLIQTDRMFQVRAACSDGIAALDKIRELQPDLAVLDMSMPGLTGVEVLRILEKEKCKTRVVFLTALASDIQILEAVARGARGLMLKEMAADDLLECLRTVSTGALWLPKPLIDQAQKREQKRMQEVDSIDSSLTAREREIVLLVAEGLSNKEVARRTGVTEGTVKIHLHNIYQKLGVANRTTMAALAMMYRDRLQPGPEASRS